MHKIFGIKEKVEYMEREGAYLIPIRSNQVGVIRTPKGYFLLGGGLENGESHIACIERECMEEAGYLVSVKNKVCSAEMYTKHPTIGYFHPIQTFYVGEILSKVECSTEKDHRFLWMEYNEIKGKLFVEMQNWALGRCFEYISGGIKEHIMCLVTGPMNMIREGKKTIELRLYDEKRKMIAVGDIITFVNVQDVTDNISVKVEELFRFNSFDELYQCLPLLECGYTEENIDMASPGDMELYYSKEKQSKYGVIGIKISQRRFIKEMNVEVIMQK